MKYKIIILKIMENIIEDFIDQIKLLINYLGENNVIISFVENGDN